MSDQLIHLQLEILDCFSVGWRLEAIDKVNNLICVASIADIDMGKLRIHYDGWDVRYDFWCQPWSNLIQPVGYCQQKGKPLSPPRS